VGANSILQAIDSLEIEFVALRAARWQHIEISGKLTFSATPVAWLPQSLKS